jgi:hypothetical protein
MISHSFASTGAGASLGLPIIRKLLGHTQAAMRALQPSGCRSIAPCGWIRLRLHGREHSGDDSASRSESAAVIKTAISGDSFAPLLFLRQPLHARTDAFPDSTHAA